MKRFDISIFLIILCVGNLLAEGRGSDIVTTCTTGDSAGSHKETAQDIVAVIRKVNAYWQGENIPEVRAFWDHAAYHTGNMEAYKLTGDKSYLDYSIAWAEHNQWKGAKSDNKAEWRYNYGENECHVLFGDWQ